MTAPSVEDIDCVLCGSPEKTRVMEKDGYPIVQCGRCGLVYVSPRIAASRLAGEVYNEGYFSAERGYGIEDHFGAAEKDACRQAAADLKIVSRFARPPGALIDVGCAGGHFLKVAGQKGWTPMHVRQSCGSGNDGIRETVCSAPGRLCAR